MKTLIVYDSVFGNTEQIALAIGNALGSQMDVEIVRVSNVKPEQLTGLKLLIVGSPTHGGRPTPAIQDFLNKISEPAIRGINDSVDLVPFYTNPEPKNKDLRMVKSSKID